MATKCSVCGEDGGYIACAEGLQCEACHEDEIVWAVEQDAWDENQDWDGDY